MRTFVRFLTRVFVRISMELQDVQSLPPRYRQPTHFAAIAEDISVIIVEIMEMVSFEHGKEIEKGVFCLA